MTLVIGGGSMLQIFQNNKNLFWIVIAGLVFVLLYRAKIAKKGQWHDDALSLEVSKGLQGFCAAAIILHHASQALFNQKKDIGILMGFTNIGVLFVGVFFFFSGYGLLKSLHIKEDYLKTFFRKRFPTILVPFYVCNIIFVAAAIAVGYKVSAIQLLAFLSGFILLNTTMWYVVEIAIFYAAFYIIFRFIKKEALALSVMGIFIIAFIVLSVFMDHGIYWLQGEWWFNASFLFFIGMIFAEFEENLVGFAKKRYSIILSVALAATVIFIYLALYMLNKFSYYGTPFYVRFQILAYQLTMIIFFVISLLLITIKLQFKNFLLKFLGKIALELYLIHYLFLISLKGMKSDFLYIILVYVFAILLASVLHKLDQKIISLFRKKKKIETV